MGGVLLQYVRSVSYLKAPYLSDLALFLRLTSVVIQTNLNLFGGSIKQWQMKVTVQLAARFGQSR